MRNVLKINAGLARVSAHVLDFVKSQAPLSTICLSQATPRQSPLLATKRSESVAIVAVVLTDMCAPKQSGDLHKPKHEQDMKLTEASPPPRFSNTNTRLYKIRACGCGCCTPLNTQTEYFESMKYPQHGHRCVHSGEHCIGADCSMWQLSQQQARPKRCGSEQEL